MRKAVIAFKVPYPASDYPSRIAADHLEAGWRNIAGNRMAAGEVEIGVLIRGGPLSDWRTLGIIRNLLDDLRGRSCMDPDALVRKFEIRFAPLLPPMLRHPSTTVFIEATEWMKVESRSRVIRSPRRITTRSLSYEDVGS